MRSNADLSHLAETEFRALEFLFSKFSTIRHINVVRPICCIPEKHLLVTEKFPGQKFNAYLVENVRWRITDSARKEAIYYAFQSGRWLRYFQQFTIRDELASFDRHKFIEGIDRKVSTIKSYGIKIGNLAKAQRFAAELSRNRDGHMLQKSGFHSDYTPSNVLVHKGSIRVIDFDRFSYNTLYDDLTRFLVFLEGFKSIVGMIDNNINRLKEAFLNGYEMTDLDSDLFDLYYLKNTLKALIALDINSCSNTKLIDKLYEKYRKHKRFKLYVKSIDRLLDRKFH